MTGSPPFRNRKEAGQLLAGRLAARGFVQPVVLALPLGGVLVGAQVANALHAPLDIVLPDGPHADPLPGSERERFYRGGRTSIDVAGRTVIVVDEGIVDAERLRAAAAAARTRRPKRIVLAAPVGVRAALDSLAGDGTETVCLLRRSRFHSLSEFYSDFADVSVDEIVSLLEQDARRRGA